MEKINPDMTFAQALELSGQKGAQIMAGYGLHCIGCHIAATETIKEGCQAHGLSENDLNEMISKINKSLDDQSDDRQDQKE